MNKILSLGSLGVISVIVLFCAAKKNDPQPNTNSSTNNRSTISGKTWRNTSTSVYPPVTVNGVVTTDTKKFIVSADSLVTIYFDLENSQMTVNTVPGMSYGSYLFTKAPLRLLPDDSTLIWPQYSPTNNSFVFDTMIVSRVGNCKMSLYWKNYPYRVFVPTDTIPHIRYFNYVCN